MVGLKTGPTHEGLMFSSVVGRRGVDQADPPVVHPRWFASVTVVETLGVRETL